VAEATTASATFPKQIDNLKFHLNNRHEYHLRKAFTGTNREHAWTAIPAGNQNLSLIIGIDEPNEIAEHNAMPMPKPRAGQDDRREPGVLDMNGEARGNQMRLARF
jgi:hypothetical protein